VNRALELSLMPFAICQRLGCGVGYERSFKATCGKVLANRYLIGLPTSEISRPTAQSIGRDLGMPAIDPTMFWDWYDSANLLLVGFEDAEPGCRFKLYLEFDETPLVDDSSGAPNERLLHRGVKWDPDQPGQWSVGDYIWQTGLERDELHENVARIVRGNPIERQVLQMVHSVTDHVDAGALRFLRVREDNRRSFDLNVYAGGFTVASIWGGCRAAMTQLGITEEAIERLETLVHQRPLGHIAAGSDRSGQAFLSIYFDATD